MYNEYQKRRYITQKISETNVTDFVLTNNFDKAAPFEEKFEKDLCDFTTDEIREMYKLSNLNSLNVLTNRNSIYKLYTAWAQTQGLVVDNQNHYNEFDINILNSLLNVNALKQNIVSKETVKTWCSNFLNARDEFVLWCIFDFGKGDYFSDIVNAKISDIDFENKIMHLSSGRNVKVSDELIAAAMESVEAVKLFAPTGRNILLYDDGTIMKKYGKSKNTTDTFYLGRAAYASLKRSLGYIGVQISAVNIMYSGIIHMIHAESEKISITGEEYLQKYRDQIEKQYDIVVKTSIMLKKYGDYI